MKDGSITELKIITAITTAFKIHKLIEEARQNNFATNESALFLSNFDIDYQTPEPHQATFCYDRYTPLEGWFLMFNDDEKIVLEDGSRFFGIRYETSIKLAEKRLRRHVEEMEKEINGDKEKKLLYKRDLLKEAEKALMNFKDDDKVSLYFMCPEWPSLEEAKETDYVSNFEKKIMKKADDCLGF